VTVRAARRPALCLPDVNVFAPCAGNVAVRVESFGFEGSLSPGVLDRLDLLPEISSFVELVGDPREDDVFVAKVRDKAQKLGFGHRPEGFPPGR
jgi:hypothetical protein